MKDLSCMLPDVVAAPIRKRHARPARTKVTNITISLLSIRPLQFSQFHCYCTDTASIRLVVCLVNLKIRAIVANFKKSSSTKLLRIWSQGAAQHVNFSAESANSNDGMDICLGGAPGVSRGDGTADGMFG